MREGCRGKFPLARSSRKRTKTICCPRGSTSGCDHFFGSLELTQYAALFIAKTAQYRLPRELPPGDAPVQCLPLTAEDGWLTDYDLSKPEHPPAPYADYTGDKSKAMWHYDGEIAKANVEHHRNAAKHQAISGSDPKWLDEGDGWTFRAHGEFLNTRPEKYGGAIGNTRVGHAEGGIIYRSLPAQPVERINADTFRLLRPFDSIQIDAINLGDENYRATNRWSKLEIPKVKGEKQQIDFPPIADLRTGTQGVRLNATASSGLPVYFKVVYGPVAIDGGKVVLSDAAARREAAHRVHDTRSAGGSSRWWNLRSRCRGLFRSSNRDGLF